MKNDCEENLKQAALAHEEGRLADAERAYREILSENPDSGSVLNALGTVLLEQSQPNKAKRVFEKAVHLNPPDLSAYYNLGRLKQMEGDDEGAITIYRAIIKHQSKFGLAWNNMGVAYREIGDPEEAISCFRRAVAFAPDMAEAWNNQGVAQDSFHLLEDGSTDYRLFPSGRYAHSQRYIRNVLKRHGLAPIGETDAVIRKQSGKEVKGLLIVAQSVIDDGNKK